MFKLTGETSYANHLEIIVEPENWSKRPSTDHILTQIIKDHFTFLYGQKHQQEPFVKLLVNSRTMGDILYNVDNKLSKPLNRFIDNLIPKTSLITIFNDDKTKTYRYLGQKDNVMEFEQVNYDNEYKPIIKIPILK